MPIIAALRAAGWLRQTHHRPSKEAKSLMQNPSRQTTLAFAVQPVGSAKRSKMLWAMSPQQRINAMRCGALTFCELCEWAKRRPEEVPLVNGELEFIAMLTPEAADSDSKQATA